MRYKSEALEAVHEQAVEMYKIGGISEDRMREYDKMCLKNPSKKESSIVYTNDDITEIKQINPAAV